MKIYVLRRSFKDDVMYVITHIQKIENFDEVTAHYLKVFLASETRKNGYIKEEPITFQKVRS